MTKKSLEKELKNLEKEREDTKKRATTWYARVERFFDLAVTGQERFQKGTFAGKQTILRDVGSNLVILDGKLRITPHP